ncbi:MAG: hypothetical protein ACRD1A_11650, partial [Terriglobales bacterium]
SEGCSFCHTYVDSALEGGRAAAFAGKFRDPSRRFCPQCKRRDSRHPLRQADDITPLLARPI